VPSGAEPEPKVEAVEEEAPKPTKKPPAGGISLFGGVNPMEALKGLKKKVTHHEHGHAEGGAAEEDAETHKEPVKKPVGGVSLFGGFNPKDALKGLKKKKDDH